MLDGRDRSRRQGQREVLHHGGGLPVGAQPPAASRGSRTFGGPVYHTGEWPHDGVDFTGLRVGVIGTGSSAIQSIPIIAQQAAASTVFQRTATYTVPAWNEKLTPEYRQSVKATYPALRAKARARPTRHLLPFNMKPALAASPEEREKAYEEAWARGGLPFLGAYGDLLFEKAANDTIADFARAQDPRHRRKIRRRPTCSARTTSSAASGCASIPATSRPTTCRM